LAAEKEFQWGIDISEVFRIWQGGCIIRSKMLEVLPSFYQPFDEKNIPDLMEQIPVYRLSLDHVLSSTAMPTPVISSIAQYFR
jgi:6-phosphogluconate dehydrogenase